MKRKLRDYGPRLLKLSRLAEETGFSLVEVLVAGLVIGVAVIGVSMMFGTGSAWVAALGEDRVGVGLAQQRIEQVRAATIGQWTTAPLGIVPEDPNPIIGRSINDTVTMLIDPAKCDTVNDQPPGCRKVPKYQRVTCIQYVNDVNDAPTPGPALVTPTYSDACPIGTATSARRITVTVTPVSVDDNLVSNNVQRGSVVTLQGWITRADR